MYCAEIEQIDGLCAYGKTPEDALRQLGEVKETAFELILSEGRKPPIPTVKFEIPADEVKRNPNLRKLKGYIKI